MTSVDSTTVACTEISPYICVTPPYYALGDLISPAPGLAAATVPVQTSTGRQATHINIAEAGRHLAILGLSAAATINPGTGRHYYLAHRGVGRMYPPIGTLTTLHGTATARMTGRNRAVAETELRDADGNLVARLDLEYLVMSAPVFRRLMGPATARSHCSTTSRRPLPGPTPGGRRASTGCGPIISPRRARPARWTSSARRPPSPRRTRAGSPGRSGPATATSSRSRWTARTSEPTA